MADKPIGLYAKIIPSAHYLYNADNTVQLGLIVDVRYTTRLGISVEEWCSLGLSKDLLGRFVTLLPGTPEAEKYPELVGQGVGTIAEIREKRVILTDTRREELTDLPLSSVAPEPTRWNLELYLEARYKRAFVEGRQELAQELYYHMTPGRRSSLIKKAVDERIAPPTRLGKLGLLPGLNATVANFTALRDPEYSVRKLNSPSFSFDPTGNKYDRRIDAGLIVHGPYDSEMRRAASINVLVLAPASAKGEVESALSKFRQGIDTPKAVFRGFETMYRIRAVNIQCCWAKVDDAQPMVGYAEAMQAAFSERDAENFKYDIIITVIRERYRQLSPSENPYFQLKAMALTLHGVPTQAIFLETLRSKDNSLQYTMNNIALACYAKIGGTSHVLKLPHVDDVDAELVFGVGRSLIRKHRLDTQEETIGFATVFRANGEYLFNGATPYCDGSAYPRALEDTISRAARAVIDYERLPMGSRLRLIFHLHRRTGARDTTPILNAIRKLPGYRIEFGLLHVNEDHDLLIFDPDNTDPVGYGGKSLPDAALLPIRGLCVAFGDRERVVTFIGPEQYKNQGCPTPIRFALDGRSTFEDLDYMAQQAYLLSFMNARSMNPGVKPVTITYAEQLANMTGHLRGVQQWTVELINTKLGRKLWFI